MNDHDARLQAQRWVDSGELSLLVLWLHYWGEGGNLGLWEFDAYLHKALVLEDFDDAILGWALEAVASR